MKRSQKGNKHKTYELEVKSNGEKPQDIKNFDTIVDLMLVGFMLQKQSRPLIKSLN